MTDLDLTSSIIAKSDQVNSDDLIAGPITVTISRVVKGSPEQPFDFQLVETPNRAYRPSKTMRRVIVEAWGPDATKYAGRRLTLYREPSITFGGQKVGGIRISHMSHIAAPVVLAAQVTKGKSETFTVQPLRNVPDGPGVGSAAEGGGLVARRDDSMDSVEPERPSGTTPSPEASEASREPLVAAVNRQIREIQAEDGAAHLRTWADSVGVKASSQAIAEKYGDAARDLRWLIGETTNA